nr:MAG TPA: hypothetical protein [Microviridae sp.]
MIELIFTFLIVCFVFNLRGFRDAFFRELNKKDEKK